VLYRQFALLPPMNLQYLYNLLCRWYGIRNGHRHGDPISPAREQNCFCASCVRTVVCRETSPLGQKPGGRLYTGHCAGTCICACDITSHQASGLENRHGDRRGPHAITKTIDFSPTEIRPPTNNTEAYLECSNPADFTTVDTKDCSAGRPRHYCNDTGDATAEQPDDDLAPPEKISASRKRSLSDTSYMIYSHPSAKRLNVNIDKENRPPSKRQTGILKDGSASDREAKVPRHVTFEKVLGDIQQDDQVRHMPDVYVSMLIML